MCHLNVFPAGRALVSLASVSLIVCGCAGGQEYETVTETDADLAEAHVDEHHDHEAPHGGELIALGDHKFNAEMVLEANPKQLVMYILGPHAEESVAIEAAPLTFKPGEGDAINFEPQPQEGDAAGQSSRFVATGERVNSLADLEEMHGSLTVTIKGNDYTGTLSHDHDEADHTAGDHAHDDGDHAEHQQDE